MCKPTVNDPHSEGFLLDGKSYSFSQLSSLIKLTGLIGSKNEMEELVSTIPHIQSLISSMKKISDLNIEESAKNVSKFINQNGSFTGDKFDEIKIIVDGNSAVESLRTAVGLKGTAVGSKLTSVESKGIAVGLKRGGEVLNARKRKRSKQSEMEWKNNASVDTKPISEWDDDEFLKKVEKCYDILTSTTESATPSFICHFFGYISLRLVSGLGEFYNPAGPSPKLFFPNLLPEDDQNKVKSWLSTELRLSSELITKVILEGNAYYWKRSSNIKNKISNPLYCSVSSEMGACWNKKME